MNIHKSILFITLFAFATGQALGQMSILSGPKKGSYYQFTNDMVKVLAEKNNLTVKNKFTGGSAYNFKMLTSPTSDYKLALIQSDYLALMEAQDRVNNTQKTASLKVVMELATEEIHIIAKKSSGIKTLQDLNMKKVGIGDENQGSFATGTMIKERSKVFWYPYQVGFNDMLDQLAKGKIDAAIMVGSTPIDILNIDPQAMKDGIALLELENFNGWARFYESDTIYKNSYPWLEKDVPTFGMRTLLVVNESKLNDWEKKAVATIKKSIVDNMEYLKKQGHPQWKTVLLPDDMPEETAATPAEKPAPNEVAAPAINEGVVYRVQIYSRNYERAEPVEIGETNYPTYVYLYLGAYRYTVGEFTTLSDAVALQKKCRATGYNQAFVAAFKNGVRSNDAALFKK